MPKQFYTIQQTARTADIYIFGDIVTEQWFQEETSAHSFQQQIEGLDVDVINVHIDSYGGAVSEGWAIYNALKNHPATINTYGDGFVASAALFPFLAGDNRYASNLSAYYLHQVIVGVQGYADDLRAAADEADLMTGIGIRAFTERTDMTEEQVRQLMEAETWLTPAQALEYGIATAILADSAPKIAQGAKKDIMQRMTGVHMSIVATVDPEPKQTPQEPEAPTPEPTGIMQLFKHFAIRKENEHA